jgi:hypothetical protein
MHNRTVQTAVAGLGLALNPASRDDEQVLVNCEVMNVGLRKHVAAFGAAGAVWRAE